MEALTTIEHWAQKYECPVDTIQADVQAWKASTAWDAAVSTFLGLLPEERF